MYYVSPNSTNQNKVRKVVFQVWTFNHVCVPVPSVVDTACRRSGTGRVGATQESANSFHHQNNPPYLLLHMTTAACVVNPFQPLKKNKTTKGLVAHSLSPCHSLSAYSSLTSLG